jgi:FkbM family methyltransferase
MWDVICNVHRYIPKPGDWVLDLGAHFGMFSLYCAARGCIVSAFEPNPEAFSELVHKVAVAHAIGRGEIIAHDVAVWNQTGFGLLFKRESSAAHTMVPMGETVGQRCVSCFSLEQVLDGRIWDCVKVDVEGAEYPIFAEASDKDLQAIRYLTMEIHNDILGAGQIRELKARLQESFRIVDRLPVLKDGVDTGQDSALFCRR